MDAKGQKYHASEYLEEDKVFILTKYTPFESEITEYIVVQKNGKKYFQIKDD